MLLGGDSVSVSGTIEPNFNRLTRQYTDSKGDWLKSIKFESRTAEIKDSHGEIVFRQENVIVPDFWSQTATNILAQKYFRKAGVPEYVSVIAENSVPAFLYRTRSSAFTIDNDRFKGENDLRQVVHRMTGHWAYVGWKHGYFNHFDYEDSNQAYQEAVEQAHIFIDELSYMLFHQIAAPNSPQWFNTGLWWAYGITSDKEQTHYARNWVSGDIEFVDSYERPQVHACFINKVEDKVSGPDGIMDLWNKEASIFKHGSGSGCNYSAIRGKNEPLSSGGVSSGLISFLKIGDTVAGSIKSAGKTRRAARMVVVNDDHSDLFEFIDWKVKEEEKVKALVTGSQILNEQDESFPVYSPSFEGEAYSTVTGQNANNSILVSDKFMHAYEENALWGLIDRTQPRLNLYDANVVMAAIANAAWKCGDPAIMFRDNINKYNTCHNDEEIITSNPCQVANALLLTPDGVRKLGELEAGATIWSAEGWTTIVKKWSTGIKPVYRYRTTAGEFLGTAEHKIIQKGIKIEVKNAKTIDVLAGPICNIINHNKQVVMDGLYLGDGYKRDDQYTVIGIGGKDQDYYDYFDDESDLWPKHFDWAYHGEIARVNVTIEDLPYTYDRYIPNKYKFGSFDNMAALLKGLFSANGCVHPNYDRISYKTTSKRMRDDIQLLLSVLGIRSYFTTNKPTKVKHRNGEYESKQSYDVNISRLEDLETFYENIGFIQDYKTEALEHILNKERNYNPKPMSCLIKEITYVGEEEVFDITVSNNSHTYWTHGLNVSNCAEYFWFTDTACNLASLNLLQFYTNKQFDIEAFKHAAHLWTMVLDISIDMASFPTAEIARKTYEYRTLGLGYTNLGGLLMVMGIPYDSERGRNIAADITALMTGQAYLTSSILAAKLGAFPRYWHNKPSFDDVLFKHYNSLWAKTENRIESIFHEAVYVWQNVMKDNTFRNAQVTVLAPTGTISLIMDAATTGVEPGYSLVTYKELSGGGNIKLVNSVVGEALENLGYEGQLRNNIISFIGEHGSIIGCNLVDPKNYSIFDSANDIEPRGHLDMVASVQPFVSGGISKTINLPNSATVEDIEDLYYTAWKAGVKAISVYRDGCKGSQPLTAHKKASPKGIKPSGNENNAVVKEEIGKEIMFYKQQTATCPTCGAIEIVQTGVCSICLVCGTGIGSCA